MRSRWTLAVEGLGRIDRAEIEVRPLTLFVGDNNSGKSYLAALLWDLYARMPEVFGPHGAEASEAYQACRRWFEDKFSHPGTYALKDKDIRLFLAWLNERLDAKKGEIVRRIFGFANMELGSIRIPSLARDAPFSLVTQWEDEISNTATLVGAHTNRAAGVVEIDLASSTHGTTQLDYLVAMITLLQGLLPAGNVPARTMKTRYSGKDPVYLPASRTGFVLLYRSLIAELIDSGTTGGGGTSEPRVPLTVPAVHFIQLLALGLRPDNRGPYASLADMIEHHAYPGTVRLKGGVGVNEIEYRYDPAAPPLPMQLAASLVTELAPLVLALRHVSDLPALFLEEPETHLHPHIIRLVAQVITRLVRRGVQICITTHSPDFCQQINNFIKLGSLPPEERARFQERYGYDADDYLEESEVAGYQFQAGVNGRSRVTRLPESPSGLAMPTFNEELIALSREALELMQAVEGDE